MLPTLFISHGSPMHAIDAGEAAGAWKAVADSIPRPTAILIASAHWETGLPMLTGRGRLETIHDFNGFPAELYRVRYDVQGAPAVAERAIALLRNAGYTAAVDGCRGIDHGAWVPLRHMYPQRDVPVVQISVQPALGAAHHLRLGEVLAPLVAQGVLVIGSGHVTHNLRDWSASRRDPHALDYVPRFAEWLNERLVAGDREAVLDYRERAPSAARAHPTEEHFLPLFVAWGAAGDGASARRVLAAIEDGALAMDAYRFDQAATAERDQT
jgi:4,5-DOPA dioxygenase extradiol